MSGLRAAAPQAPGALLAAEREPAVQLLARAFRDNPLNVAVIGSDDPARRLRVNAHGLRSLLPIGARARPRAGAARGGELAGGADRGAAGCLPAAGGVVRAAPAQQLRPGPARRAALGGGVRGARAAAPARAALVPEHPRRRSRPAAARARAGAARRLARRRRPRRELRLPRDRSPRERRLLRARGLRRAWARRGSSRRRCGACAVRKRAARERARGTRLPAP